MIGARIEQLEPGQLYEKAETLRHAGARVQFAYAWSPEGDDREVRYVWAIPDQTDFEVWAVAARELPSLAPVWPLLGWYEREMMDLQGVKFVGHPEPYPLILRRAIQLTSTVEIPNLCSLRTVAPPSGDRGARRPTASVRPGPSRRVGIR